MHAWESFVQILDGYKITYRQSKTEEGIVYISMGVNGENFTGLQIQIFFDGEDADTAALRIFELHKFKKEQSLLALQTVNSLNCSYRWISFCVSQEGQLIAGMDVQYDKGNGGEAVFRALCRFVSVMDAAYPKLMKAAYSDT